MCTILLSIKPEYANKIFSEDKKFEFRRSIPKKKVETIIVYSSSPEQKIIGEFKVKEIHEKNLSNLWKETKAESGITKSFFNSYFQGKEKGYAYEVGKLKKYKEKKNLKDLNIKSAPQSFMYINLEK